MAEQSERDRAFSLGNVVLQDPKLAEAWTNAVNLGLKGPIEQAAKQKQAEQTEFKWNSKDNTVEGKMPADLMKEVAGKAKAFDQIQANYDRMLAMNLAKQEQIAQHPFANTLAQIGAGLASTSRNPTVAGLGVAARALNPTQAQLQEQEMGILAGKGKVAAEQLQEQRFALQMTREQQQAIQGMERDAGIAARQGEFSKELFIPEALAAGAPKERVMAAAARLDGVSNDKKLLRAQAEASAEAKHQAQITDQINKENRATAEWWDRHNKEQQELEAREVRKEAVRTAAEARKDESKRKDLGPVLEAKVEDILTAKRSTNRLLEIFDPNTRNPEYKHFQAIVGPIAGRETDIEKWLGTLSTQDAQLVAKINLQFANAVKTLGAGSYGYRISERGFLQSFTEALKNGAPQNYGNLIAWSTFYRDKIESFKDIKDLHDWSRVDAVMQTPPGTPFPEDRPKAPLKISVEEINKYTK